MNATWRSAGTRPSGWPTTSAARHTGCAASTTLAEGAYGSATEHGHPAQPGRALLWLAQDHRDAAAAAVLRLLAERQHPVHRSQILAAAVEVLVATGDTDRAAPLAQELREVGETFGCTALQAAGYCAVALVELAQGAAEPALLAARRAVQAWTQLSAPFEVARSADTRRSGAAAAR